jgi:hypothetical protein
MTMKILLINPPYVTLSSRLGTGHQILAQPHLAPWKMFIAVKWLELCFHARPGRLWHSYKTKDNFLRRQLMWSFIHTGMVWFIEILLWMLRSSKQTFENLGLLPARAERDKAGYEKIEKVRSLPVYKATDICKISYLDLKKCGIESGGPSVVESDVCSTWMEAIPDDISDDKTFELFT